MPNIAVQTRSLGETQSHEGDTVVLEIMAEQITAEALIKRGVEEYARAEQTQREMHQPSSSSSEKQRYGSVAQSEQEIVAQARRGVIGTPIGGPAAINISARVQSALRAFETGRYLLLVDGRRVKALDEVLVLQPGCRVVFWRLMPLAGG